MHAVSAFFRFAVVAAAVNFATLPERTRAALFDESGQNKIFSSAIQSSTDALIQESLDDLSAKMKGDQMIKRRRRPFVTLAYAQSIDGKIALVLDTPKHNNNTKNEEISPTPAATTATKKTSSNFAISGPESLRLTHALRSIHDAILVGGKTLSVDNPRLSNRLWPEECENNIARKQPLTIILDTHLHHVRSLGIRMKAKCPIVCCSVEAYRQAQKEGYRDPNGESGYSIGISKIKNIPSSARLLPCKTKIIGGKENREVLDLSDVLPKLQREFGINSLMVEGGATVLSLFVSDAYENVSNGDDNKDQEECYNDKSLFDCLCVTISPKLLGANGLDSLPLGNGIGGCEAGNILGPLKCINLGDDCVLFADRRK